MPTLIGYVGTDSGNAANYVFTVSLNAGPIEGEYTFNLLRPLDHAVHGSEDLLGLTINVIGSDTAGQVTTAINISVQDDVPVIVAANETHTTLLDPVSGGVATDTGSLGISWGSDRFNDHVNGGTSTGDGDRAVVFADHAVLVTGNGEGGATSIAQLTSHGETVHYVLADNGTTLIAYTGTAVPTGAPADAAAAAAAQVVFVVTLSDSGDTGGYSISQYQPLDHDAGGQTFSSIDLKFNFTATDSDGDPASGVLNVTVADTNRSAPARSLTPPWPKAPSRGGATPSFRLRRRNRSTSTGMPTMPIRRRAPVRTIVPSPSRMPRLRRWLRRD